MVWLVGITPESHTVIGTTLLVFLIIWKTTFIHNFRVEVSHYKSFNNLLKFIFQNPEVKKRRYF